MVAKKLRAESRAAKPRRERGWDDMRKSEILQAELDQLKEEEDIKVRVMVFYPEHKSEDHDADWERYWKEYGSNSSERKSELEFEIRKEQNREMGVGDGVTVCLYSDQHAATIIKRTKATVVVQYDKAIRDPSFKPEWTPGGFSAICTNQEQQEWTYERNPEGRTERYFWSEVRGRWQGGGDGSIVLIPGRHEFYDFNF